METVEKKAAANANDVVIPIADAKDEYLSSRRSQLSTSKSSASPAHARGADLVEETTQLLTSPAANNNNNNNNKFTDSTGEVNLESYSDEDEDDVHKDEQKRKILKKPFVLIEWAAFGCIMALLICSLTVKQLQNHVIWDFKLWKWCVFLLVIVSCRLVTKSMIKALLFLIERNSSLRQKFMYYVHGLRIIIRVFVWLSLFLLVRILLFRHGVKRSKETTKILNYVTRVLASSLVGAALWCLKSLSVLLLAVSFQSKRFFNPIQETIFHQYLIQTLSGPPLMEINEQVRSEAFGMSAGKEKYVIDVRKLKKIKRQKISAWTMKKLIDVARSSKLSVFSNQLEECAEEEDDDEDGEIFKNANDKSDEELQMYKSIKSEFEAKSAANYIFKNVASKDIFANDPTILCFLIFLLEFSHCSSLINID